jgi:hypothetical protein
LQVWPLLFTTSPEQSGLDGELLAWLVDVNRGGLSLPKAATLEVFRRAEAHLSGLRPEAVQRDEAWEPLRGPLVALISAVVTEAGVVLALEAHLDSLAHLILSIFRRIWLKGLCRRLNDQARLAQEEQTETPQPGAYKLSLRQDLAARSVHQQLEPSLSME